MVGDGLTISLKFISWKCDFQCNSMRSSRSIRGGASRKDTIFENTKWCSWDQVSWVGYFEALQPLMCLVLSAFSHFYFSILLWHNLRDPQSLMSTPPLCLAILLWPPAPSRCWGQKEKRYRAGAEVHPQPVPHARWSVPCLKWKGWGQTLSWPLSGRSRCSPGLWVAFRRHTLSGHCRSPTLEMEKGTENDEQWAPPHWPWGISGKDLHWFYARIPNLPPS